MLSTSSQQIRAGPAFDFLAAKACGGQAAGVSCTAAGTGPEEAAAHLEPGLQTLHLLVQLLLSLPCFHMLCIELT